MPPLEPIVPRDSGLRRSFCQPRDYCGIVQREFRWLGYDEDNRNHTYLRITFADSSRLDLALPPKANPDRALNLVRNTSRSAGGSPPR